MHTVHLAFLALQKLHSLQAAQKQASILIYEILLINLNYLSLKALERIELVHQRRYLRGQLLIDEAIRPLL